MNPAQTLRELLHLNRSGDVPLELRTRMFGAVYAVVVILSMLGAIFTGSLMDAPGSPAQWLLLAFLLLVLVLWKLGRVNLAGYFLVWGLWIFVTLVIVSETGRASHWLVPQFLLVILARFILNGRAAILLGVITAGFDYAIYRFGFFQYLPANWRELAYGNDWVAIVMAFAFLVFLFTLVDYVLREGLRKAQLTEGRYRSLFDKTNDAVYLVNGNHTILSVNQKAAELLGYRVDEMIGKPYAGFVAPDEKQKVLDNFKHLDKEGAVPLFERLMVRKDGSRCRVEFNANAIRDEQGKLLYYQGVARDLTERKRLEEQLRYSLEEMETLAMQDPLTGLLNRRAITDHAEAEWHRSSRERRPMCIALIDLDNLKDVNDTLGHQVGDQVIMELAAVIKASRRRYDWAGRWGGDEFMLVLPGANLVEAHDVADRLRNEYSESTLVTGIPRQVRPHASVGVACFSGRPGEEIALNQLITQADLALYQAKQMGKNRVEVFRDEIKT